MDSLIELRDEIKTFVEERDWDQFHSPANLAKSISIESAELLECFQWDNDKFDKEAVMEELADVMNYCIQMGIALNVDLKTIIEKKMAKNAKKYPVEKCRGVSTKYDKL
jgi:NTP pyrophosphatase (non-canonical NTP hydrolase)